MLYTQQKALFQVIFMCLITFLTQGNRFEYQENYLEIQLSQVPDSCHLIKHPRKKNYLVNVSIGNSSIPFNTSQCFQLMRVTFLSSSVCHFWAPRPPHSTPAVCVWDEEQGLLSISCQPAGEPLLPVTSSRKPACLFNSPRGSHECLLVNTKKRILAHRKCRYQIMLYIHINIKAV